MGPASPSVATLPWLPAPPEDFSARCRALSASSVAPGPALQQLANFALDARQSLSLARAIARCRVTGLSPLSDYRLGILASATFDLIVDCIPAAAARHGLAVEIFSAPYDQVVQEAFNPKSGINRARLDGVLIAVDHRWLKLDRAGGEGAPAALARLRSVVENLRAHGGAAAILQTVPVPPQALFGSYDRRWASSLRTMIDEFNRGIAVVADEFSAYVLDVAALAERVGTDLWFDPVHWVSYKLPFAAECFPVYAEMLGRLLGAIRGKARKCLVLDLDNTIWGGVVGDDGVEGIYLGQGSARGEAFLSVQHCALELRERGVVLAVSSKNNDDVARRPFREHPDMLLKESHIAVFQANWEDKPSNLEAIAETLNIGLDALVMLDDNPAERAQIRAALPMVAVPELPSDPSRYAWYLMAAGYFEAVAYSTEDAARAESYTSDAHRAEVRTQTRDLGEYLSSLGMTIRFQSFDAASRKRITQLINKTNQFNLTTRRYSEAEVAAMELDSAIATLQARLVDRFGDLGMIGVVICRPWGVDGVWEIDTWLMSCRVLGRRVEEAMLARVAEDVRRRGGVRLVGRYIPTAKNAMVKDLFERLGFALVEESDTERRYELALDAYVAPELPLSVE